MAKTGREDKTKDRMTQGKRSGSIPEARSLTEKLSEVLNSLRGKMLVVFVFAFTMRFLFLHQFRTDPFFDHPLFDAELYSRWATFIAEGDWLGKNEGAFFVSPLYAYFLAALKIIFNYNPYWIVFAQLLLGSVHCVLIYLIGRKLFGEAVGLISALFASLYGFFLYTEAQLLKNSLAYSLSTLSFFLFLISREKQKPLLWAALGISTGLTALVIPNVLIFVPIIYGTLVFEKGRPKKWLAQAGALSIGLFITIAPVTLRNYYAGEDMVMISSNGGINLFLGADLETDGGLRISKIIEQAPELEEQSSKAIAEKVLQKKLKPSEVSSFWYSRAIENIRENPAASLFLLIKKIYRFWNWRELTDNLDFYYFREKYLPLGIPLADFGTIAPLSLLGLWFSRKEMKKLLPALIFILVFMAVSVPFPIYGRYRTPVVPLLIVFASFGMYALYLRLSQKKWKDVAVGLSVFVVTFAIINSGARDHDFSLMHRALGEIYLKKDEPGKAVMELKKAVDANPNNFYSRNALGQAYLEIGKYDDTIRELEIAVSLYPGFVDAHYTLGLAYAITGNRKAALVELQKVIVLDVTGERSQMMRKLLMGENKQ